MKEPLTYSQYQKLKERFARDEGLIPQILQAMHNWQPLTSKRVNAYLTFLAFAKKEQQSV